MMIWAVLVIIGGSTVSSKMASEDNYLCDLTSLQESCKIKLLSTEKKYLRGESKRISNCFAENQIAYDKEILTQMTSYKKEEIRTLKCLLRDLRTKAECGVNENKNCQTIRSLFCDDLLEDSVNSVKAANDFLCVQCKFAHFREMLYSNTHELTRTIRSEVLSLALLLTHFMVTQNRDQYVISDWLESFLDIESWKNCSYMNTESEELKKTVEDLKQERMESKRGYYDNKLFLLIVLSVIAVVISVIGNGVVLVIFVRHGELRTDPNMMVFNLAVAHLLYNLMSCTVMFTPSLWKLYWETTEPTVTSLAFVWMVIAGACVYSVTIMSIQRYRAVTSKTRLGSGGGTVKRSVIRYVVWLLSCLLSVPMAAMCASDPKQYLRIIALFNFIVYSAIPVVTVTTLSVMTSRKLRQSVKDMPGETRGLEKVKHSRVRNAKVLLALSVSFTITYFPAYLVDAFDAVFNIMTDVALLYMAHISFLLMYVNSCVNPIALYIVSENFRKYFDKYLLCWFSGRFKGKSENYEHLSEQDDFSDLVIT